MKNLKMLIITLTTLISILCSSVLYANVVLIQPSQWSGWTMIERLYPGDNTYFIVTDKKFTEEGTCDGGRQFYLAPEDKNYDAKVKILTAGFLAGKEIQFKFEDVGNNCRAHVYKFQIR